MNAELPPFETGEHNSKSGLWSSKEESTIGLASLYPGLITNTSKEMTCFSDFPMPAEWPNYFTAKEFAEYLHMYAEKFDLTPHIRFHHSVQAVTKAASYEEDGRWMVKVLDKQTDIISEHMVDAVIICTGKYAYPAQPDLPGMQRFQGKILHSHSYGFTTPKPDERVLVVGNGSSGCDIACHCLTYAKKPVYLSKRRGVWILTRDSSRPIDMVVITTFMGYVTQLLPTWLPLWLLQRKLKAKFDYKKYDLLPETGTFKDQIAINDDIQGALERGDVVTMPGIERFTETGVVFTDGQEQEFDTVIMATGYRVQFPFTISSDVINPEAWKVYKKVWPADLTHNTLALIGFVRLRGPAPPLVEMQARWAAAVFKGRCVMPSREDLRQIPVIVAAGDPQLLNHKLVTDNHTYYKDMATQLSCEPNMVWLFFASPLRFWRILFGSAVPCLYRLYGPGAWPNAWNTFSTAWSRVRAATNKQD